MVENCAVVSHPTYPPTTVENSGDNSRIDRDSDYTKPIRTKPRTCWKLITMADMQKLHCHSSCLMKVRGMLLPVKLHIWATSITLLFLFV